MMITVTSLLCKSLWIKASAKYINANATQMQMPPVLYFTNHEKKYKTNNEKKKKSVSAASELTRIYVFSAQVTLIVLTSFHAHYALRVLGFLWPSRSQSKSKKTENSVFLLLAFSLV